MTFVMGDGEFTSLEQLTNLLMGAPWLNLTSANKHEPFIDHCICVVNSSSDMDGRDHPLSN